MKHCILVIIGMLWIGPLLPTQASGQAEQPGQASDRKKVVIRVNHGSAKALASAVTKLVKEVRPDSRVVVVADPEANNLIVTGTEDEIRMIKELLHT